MIQKFLGLACILILGVFIISPGCTQTGQAPSTPVVTPAATPGLSGSVLLISQTTQTQPPSSPSVSPTINPPQGTVSVYKGVWMPRGFAGGGPQYRNHPVDNVTLLKKLNANIIMVGLPVYIDINGNIATRTTPTQIDDRLKELTETYYPNNIRIGIVVIAQYSDTTFTPGVQPSRQGLPAGAAKPFSPDLLENPHYFDNYNQKVGEYAALSDKYKTEMFCPMNEPDYLLGSSFASRWGQDILPLVKQQYQGKVLYRPALSPAVVTTTLNTTGYDSIGVTVSPRLAKSGTDLENLQDEMSQTLDTIKGWADRDHVPEIMFGEIWFGFGTRTSSDDYKAKAVREIFAAGHNRSQGYIIYDPYPDLEYQFVGTTWFNEVASQFRRT